MLTNEQLTFLMHHNIPLDKVMDATGLARTEYATFMSQEGMLVACGVTPCREAGHTLRTRKGHCAQCNPAAIAFLKRWNESASIYIAESVSKGLCKVGSASNAPKRIEQLNRIGYGEADDWSAFSIISVPGAGKIESLVHKELAGYREIGKYRSHRYNASCVEIFECGPEFAFEALLDVLRREHVI